MAVVGWPSAVGVVGPEIALKVVVVDIVDVVGGVESGRVQKWVLGRL